MRRYINELGKDHYVRDFENLKQFEHRYFFEQTNEENDDDEEDEALKKLSSIDLIIIKYSLIKENFQKWISEAQLKLKGFNLWRDEGTPTQFIITKYENDGVKKGALIHPYVADLILLPLDRLIFLQKLEIILELPKMISPSFLYVQDINDEWVEISRKSKIIFLTDLGLAISSPVPLKEGIIGHFYFKLPGRDETLDLYARSLVSKEDPENPKSFTTYFSFFGAHKHPLSEVRKYITGDRFYKPLINQNAEDFTFNPDSIFLSEEEKRPRTIVIIDTTLEEANNLSEEVLKEVGPVNVIAEDSLYLFKQKYLSPEYKEKLEKGPPPPVTKEDLFGDVISWSIDAKSFFFHKLLTVPESAEEMEKAHVLGHPAEAFFAEPESWKKIFSEKGANEMLHETLHNILAVPRLTKCFELKDAEGNLKITLVEFQLLEDKQHIQITLREPTEEDIREAYEQIEVKTIDLLIIDYSFLPEDPAVLDKWYDNLCEEIINQGLSSAPMPLIVIAQETQDFDILSLSKNYIFSFIFKPVYTRRLLFDISTALNLQYTLYNFDNIGWKETSLETYIAKKAKLEKISEFGAQIFTDKPIKIGSPIYIHGSIFENAPGQNLCARPINNREAEGDQKGYHCFLLYFGIDEMFLKFTRNWIRERYAASKDI
ncbi:MAG: hypothetical protein D6797_02155 [Bdellovibrio sp.]|nr:MAG: hypothetical protein D6797_02155 [Bdellovibrio sp.]